MINRTIFFDTIKASLFDNHLEQSQVNGMNAVLDEWNENSDLHQLAYVLATIFHETGETMQPIKEGGGEAYLKSKPYYPYYGRDLCQTTHLSNYEKVKQFSGIDVVNNPELIGQMPLSAKVAITFMLNGWYTGRSLKTYFNDKICDPYNARRIINGIDKAQLISGYWKKFYDALNHKQ